MTTTTAPASTLIWRLLLQADWKLPQSLSEITALFLDDLIPELIADAPSADRDALADAFEALTDQDCEGLAFDLRDVLHTAMADCASYDSAWG